MNKKLKQSLVALSSIAVLGITMGVVMTTNVVAGSSAESEVCVHEGNHYVRKEATSSASGVKEYAVCCKCQALFVAEKDEFVAGYRWGNASCVQINILNNSVFAASNFLAEDNGYKINYGEGSATAGWFGADKAGDTGVITAHFNSDVASGTKFTVLAGSYITSTDGNVYKFASDVSVTFNGSDWTPTASWTATGKSGEALSTSDVRYIPSVATDFTVSLGWSNANNVQMTPSVSIDGAADGDRLSVDNAADHVETNIATLSASARVWNETTIGLDPTTFGSTTPAAGSYVILKSGTHFTDKNGKGYQLSQGYTFVCNGSSWEVYDTENNGVVTSASAGALGGTVAYVTPNGTNCMSYAEGSNPGGIIPDQAQYVGSIKFCGVEFNNLKTFSDSIHLFATINGAGWNGTTLSVKIYDNDTWVSQGYSCISDFSAYDFDVETITIEIASGTVVKLTNGDGGTYFFKNAVKFAYDAAANVWKNA